MAGNSFGGALRQTTFGESHGIALGCVVDGCPAGVPLEPQRLAQALARRRPGQSTLTTARAEGDEPEILSGVYQGMTLGTPIAVLVRNHDAKSKDYSILQENSRAGHADFTYRARYGHVDPRGGGRASARETIGRVAAGAIAEAILEAWRLQQGRPAIEVVAWVQSIGDIQADTGSCWQIATAGHAVNPATLTRAEVDQSLVRCPDAQASQAMIEAIDAARLQRDSLGGIVRCIVRGLPAGWGDPVFDKLTGTLSHALMSLPAARGVQFGSGFSAATMRGSQHNDAFVQGDHGAAFATNHHGGLLGGISSGADLCLELAFKPPATIAQPQQGWANAGHPQTLQVGGRHDPCVLPRAVPLVEAAVAFCLADAMLRVATLTSGGSHA